MCYSYREHQTEAEARRRREEQERTRRKGRFEKAEKKRAKEGRELVKA